MQPSNLVKTSDKKPIKELTILEDKDMMYEEIIGEDGFPTFISYSQGNILAYTPRIENDDEVIVPVNDDSLGEGAVLLSGIPQSYTSETELIAEIQQHIHHYLDVSPEFEIFSSYYVLLSYVFDRVHTLPYLRALGDTGSGKSRFLDIIGGLCYRASIVSGSITPAPIYRMIKRWRGTLVLDEADFKDSDEKNEVVTILNCGFEKGRPVIRCDANDCDKLLFLPTFAPKVFATRYTFKDKALESRCLTEILTQTRRTDIPVVLGEKYFEARRVLRAKLMMFRVKNYHFIKDGSENNNIGTDIEPRLRQATLSFSAMFSQIPELKVKFEEYLKKYNTGLVVERSDSFDGEIVSYIIDCILHGIDIITPSMIAEQLKCHPRTIGVHLKSLGISVKIKSIDGVTKRVIIITKNMAYLAERYVASAEIINNFKAILETKKIDEFLPITENEGKNLTCVIDEKNVTQVTQITEEIVKNEDNLPENNPSKLRNTQITDNYGGRGMSNITQVTEVTQEIQPTPPLPPLPSVIALFALSEEKKVVKNSENINNFNVDFPLLISNVKSALTTWFQQQTEKLQPVEKVVAKVKEVYDVTDEKIDKLIEYLKWEGGLLYSPRSGYIGLIS